jgi:hypothetical protein
LNAVDAIDRLAESRETATAQWVQSIAIALACFRGVPIAAIGGVVAAVSQGTWFDQRMVITPEIRFHFQKRAPLRAVRAVWAC